MSHRTTAQVILDSITPYGEATRLTSMYVVFPKMILGERNRHRGFSLSDRSSRAVPPEKLIQEVRDDPAMPAAFKYRVKGMGGGELMTGLDLESAIYRWKRKAYFLADEAEEAAAAGEAKETANRPLDPFIRMHSLITATRDVWLNFFGLRLDAAADPTIQVFAHLCFEAYRGSTPTLLQPGQWHLPFVDVGDWEVMNIGKPIPESGPGFVFDHPAIKLSAARCAHLSYNDLETGKRMTIERALAIYNRLANSRPLHASPMEHQATPSEWLGWGSDGKMTFEEVSQMDGYTNEGWSHPDQWGNFFGWRQARKMLPGEAVASLPEGYELG